MLFEQLPGRPIITAPWVVEAFSTTKPTAGRAIQALEDSGILVETTGKKRDRIYAYQAYLDRLRAGTELSDDNWSWDGKRNAASLATGRVPRGQRILQL